MRSFTLKNARGQVWDLNDSNFFFHSVKGLGQEHKTTYIQVGTDFVKEKDYLAQKKITGKIAFKSYEMYHQFSRFIQYKPLTLTYEANGTYHIQVSVDRLAKAEMTVLGLNSDVTFTGLGTYYRIITKENLREDKSAQGKIYPVKYPYTYYDIAQGTVLIESDSILDSPVKINIFGASKNPSYAHYVNGELVATGRINATITEGHKIVLDTTQIPYRISEYTVDNEFIQNLYEKSDFSTDRFIMLRNGENKIVFSHELSEAITIAVEGYLRYESV